MSFEKIIKIFNGKKIEGVDINILFPFWEKILERVIIGTPHDDDAMIGAGLLLCELRQENVDVYIAIMTDGNKGYCKEEQKNDIISIRKKETREAYECIGIDSEHIKWFDLPDSDLFQYAYRWEDEKGKDNGLVAQFLKYCREKKATRFLLPNPNDFHLDHQATFWSNLYSVIQASEPIIPNFGGKPSKRKTILSYGVWSPFEGSPTHAIKTSKNTLDRKLEGIFCYKSQEQIESIKEELKKRGPYEYFQEYIVRSFPTEEYKKEFFPEDNKTE